MDVLGTMSAEVDGEQREWLTIESGVEGMDGASAIWVPSAVPAQVAAQVEGMNPHQQAALERVTAMMGGDNPLASGGDRVDVRITGFDPEAERMLREGMLSVEVRRLVTEDMDAVLGKRHEAEVSYFRNRGPNTGLYVSSHPVGTATTVEFDRLELGATGHANGRFSATLCPVSTLMGSGGPDASLCETMSGEFSTDLKEEEPAAATP